VKANKTEDAPEEDDDKAKLKKMMNRDMRIILDING
jgi:hypothetical protein